MDIDSVRTLINAAEYEAKRYAIPQASPAEVLKSVMEANN